MYRVSHGSAHGLADVLAFLETLNREGAGVFVHGEPVFVTRAPGRLDVMGGIADYSGSLVLELPLGEAALAAVQAVAEPVLHITSMGAEENHRAARFEMPLGALDTLDYAAAQPFFRRDPLTAWAAYAAGAFLVLKHERGVRFERGARILIDSKVPEGKGVSSSAALEVAVMQGVAAAFGIPVEPREMALLCQKVENLVVGAPCGVMDQMTAVRGEQSRLLALLCQPAELCGMVELPTGISVWGVDSGVRHAVSGADYSSVRTGAFMGLRIIGVPRVGNYLARLEPSEFEQYYAPRLPERMTGSEFLARYDGTADTVTRVEPGREYAVRMPAAHPVYEHYRVRTFAELLAGPLNESALKLLGELMYQSHASYSACGLGSHATDRLVEMARDAGPKRGIYGAKITGGGSGGTVCVLGRVSAIDAVEEIAAAYASESGHRPYLFRGSSPGAATFGYLKLEEAA
jgi:L-arabinokinase